MKKFLMLVPLLLVCLMLCACGATQETVTASTPEPTPTPTPSPEYLYAEVKEQYPADGTVGFYLQDLDGDGIKELLVGNLTGDIYEKQVIKAMYTIKDGSVTEIFESSEGDKYYLTENGTIAEEAIKNTFEQLYTYYTYSNGNLKNMVSVTYDMVNNKDNPWYQTVAGQNEVLEEKAAMDYIQAYQNTYRNIEFE